MSIYENLSDVAQLPQKTKDDQAANAKTSSGIRVKCHNCTAENLIPSNDWSVRCSCKRVILVPPTPEFKYVETNCNGGTTFRLEAERRFLTCKCCYIKFRIGNNVVEKNHGQDVYETELVENYIAKMEKETELLKKENEELKTEIQRMKLSERKMKEAAMKETDQQNEKNLTNDNAKEKEDMKKSVKKEIEDLKESLKKELKEELLQELSQEKPKENKEGVPETTISEISKPHIPLNTATCDRCKTTRSFKGWYVSCTTPECNNHAILANIEPGFRYISKDCCSNGGITRTGEDNVWITCKTCYREFIIHNTIEMIVSGQPVYETFCTREVADELNIELKQSEKRVKELQMANETKEKEMAELKQTKEKAVELAEMLMAKVTEEAMKNLKTSA